MELDEDKIDDAVLALLWPTLHDERRAWKGFDWAALGRLHRKGLNLDPVRKVMRVPRDGGQPFQRMVGAHST